MVDLIRTIKWRIRLRLEKKPIGNKSIYDYDLISYLYYILVIFIFLSKKKVISGRHEIKK